MRFAKTQFDDMYLSMRDHVLVRAKRILYISPLLGMIIATLGLYMLACVTCNITSASSSSRRADLNVLNVSSDKRHSHPVAPDRSPPPACIGKCHAVL